MATVDALLVSLAQKSAIVPAQIDPQPPADPKCTPYFEYWLKRREERTVEALAHSIAIVEENPMKFLTETLANERISPAFAESLTQALETQSSAAKPACRAPRALPVLVEGLERPARASANYEVLPAVTAVASQP